MKYMVMECHLAYAVVLSEEGRFLKVANMRYEIGQTVTDVIPADLPERAEREGRKGWVKTLSAMAACFLLMVTVLLFTGGTPYASVYMTINPGVRIDVNRSDKVVGMEGVNQDGVELIQEYDYRKKDLDLVMDELVDLAIDKGYLHEGGKVTIQLDGDDAWITNHEDHITMHLNDYLADKITVKIDLQPIRKPEPVQTAPEEIVVIPVEPEHYGESDYDEEPDTEGISDYAEESETEGLSDYEQSDEDFDITGYDDENDDGLTDYTSDDGNSDYDPDPKTTPYESPNQKEPESPYKVQEPKEAESPYEAPEPKEAESPYEELEPEDDSSDYEPMSKEKDTESDYDEGDDSEEDDED